VLALALSLGCDGEAMPQAAAPSEPSELHAWLLDREYDAWEPDRGVLPSEAGGGARVFVSPALADSLADESDTHPVGAAAVREIYEPDLVTLRGWAAIVKREDQAGADAWLWFEVFGLDEDLAPLVAQSGAPGCATCHDEGVDSVRSTLPLR
jgi:hypothetical protein